VTKPDQNDVQDSSAGIQRRTVVRAGAHAAWAVPAITLATAAPAMAISGTSNAVATLLSASRSGSTVTLTGGAISNLGTTATQNLTVAVTVTPDDPTTADFQASSITTPAQFNLTSTVPNDDTNSVTFIFTSIGNIGVAGSRSFNPTVTLAPTAGPGSITISPNITNGSEVPASTTFA
jgi:hypothetical protein